MAPDRASRGSASLRQPSRSSRPHAAAPPTAAPPSAAAAVRSAGATPAPTPLVTPAPIDASVPGPNGGQIIRWFVGLGAGGQPQQIQVQTDFVNDVQQRSANKDGYISLEIYDNKVAANILKTQIAAGNAPDIIGPVGVEGLNLFIDQLADLQPQIDSTGYDMSKYPEALADFFKIGKGGATIGVPFGTYPSFLWYNKKLFDEAKLAYPPTKVGDLYEGKPWDMAAVRDLGMKLTVDKNGNDATSADFDPANIVQWGFDSQWADNSPTAETALFGAELVPRRRRQDRPDPRRAADRHPLVQRRRLEGPLHPDPDPGRQRPAREGQPVPVGQPRDGRDPHLVLVLREPGGAGQADRR